MARRKRNSVPDVVESERKSVIFSPDKKKAVVFGLRPNSVNYAQISVLNGQNEGAPTEPIAFRTKEGGLLCFHFIW